MPIVSRNYYGRKPRADGEKGYYVVTPTKQRFVEADGTDVRLDRVRVFNGSGKLVSSFLQDKMGQRFVDNQLHTEDDVAYLRSLSRESK